MLFQQNLKENLKNITIAYEPVWAIGTGKTVFPQQADSMCKKIKNFIKFCTKILDFIMRGALIMILTVYTNYLIMTYDIVFSGTKEELAKALDEGPVFLSTKEGASVFVNPINAALIEIKDSPLT